MVLSVEKQSFAICLVLWTPQDAANQNSSWSLTRCQPVAPFTTRCKRKACRVAWTG